MLEPHRADLAYTHANNRLIIRPLTVADFEAMHAMWSDAEVMGPVPSKACDREASWVRLGEKMGHQAEHGFSRWAVVPPPGTRMTGD